MKFTILIIIMVNILFCSCTNGQVKNNVFSSTQSNESMTNFHFSLETAHPKAQALMTDSFFWSPIEETAPFGSDDGADAAYGFIQWRQVNKTSSPVDYLDDLIASWQYPYFNYNEMDTSKIREYIFSKDDPDETYIQQQMQMLRETLKNSPDTTITSMDDKQLRELVKQTSKGMGTAYVTGQDNAIIGTGFAQFVLEGHIDNDIKDLTITAIKRELLPILINQYDNDYREIRKEQLTKMLEVMNKTSL